MTEKTITTITPTDAAWPEFSPRWASSGLLDESGAAITFEREWSVPSLFRDAAPLPVLRVEQSFTFSPAMECFVAGETWVRAGGTGAAMWADWRREEISSLLRDIADALAPLPAECGPSA